MKIEAITVCVGYDDFLAQTLPENLIHFDNMVIITANDDKDTVKVCRKHSVHCVTTDEHLRDGPFNKYRMLQKAIDQIGAKEWVLVIDADIILPRKFRKMLNWAHLDEKNIYGADRQSIIGWDKWQNMKKYVGAWDNHAWECGHWAHPEYALMSRWVSSLHGYVPPGYFQLFHGSEVIQGGYHHKKFNLDHGDAARCDIQFGLQWDRRNRVLLPEVLTLHLESEASPLGANWNGRKTMRFGPPEVQKKIPYVS